MLAASPLKVRRLELTRGGHHIEGRMEIMSDSAPPSPCWWIRREEWPGQRIGPVIERCSGVACDRRIGGCGIGGPDARRTVNRLVPERVAQHVVTPHQLTEEASLEIEDVRAPALDSFDPAGLSSVSVVEPVTLDEAPEGSAPPEYRHRGARRVGHRRASAPSRPGPTT